MDLGIVRKIWECDIVEDYECGCLTTEHALQASLYFHVRRKLPELEIFVEPGMLSDSKGSAAVFPDLVLCEGGKIVLIAELKFVPHGYPRFKHDLQKLMRFYHEGSAINHQLQIDPMSGKFSDSLYKITRTTKYAFFVIGRHDAEAVHKGPIDSFLGDGQFRRNFSLFYGRTGNAGGRALFGSDFQ
ncbi:MAG: hypothetical protein D6717_14580 [Gammaproteobacteria bacterium]|nr:MAG: hypothetical protein D6717_14580 [Gammaproteobacteria bacterium]